MGAAWRLRELGHSNFKVYEKNDYPGGLAASFKDPLNFTWDVGGHVIFSRYDYFHRLLDNVLGKDILDFRREAWIRTLDRWIPYPFQHNLRNLPKDVIEECLQGLKEIHHTPKNPSNFEEWVLQSMGRGIAKHFMLPYNFKVWAYPLALLSADWIADRVGPVKLEDVVAHLISETDKTDWGPNATFKFPLFGGTGEIFRRMAGLLSGHMSFGSELLRIDSAAKKVVFTSGQEEHYDVLINSSPLDQLIARMKDASPEWLRASSDLKHNGVFIVGLGMRKPAPGSKCWVYFPDDTSPFYRMTYFSNYSPNHVPDASNFYSVICESAYSEYKKEAKDQIEVRTLEGLIRSAILDASDKNAIVSRFFFDLEYAYPIPTLGRDAALRLIQRGLEARDIFSRGRFGAWKYEIGNMDHSIMQGKEVVDRILGKGEEQAWNL